jgi:hypothetical protein
MTITISPELEAQVRNKAQAEGLSVDAYVERLIREEEEWARQLSGAFDENDPDFPEIHAAISEAARGTD